MILWPQLKQDICSLCTRNAMLPAADSDYRDHAIHSCVNVFCGRSFTKRQHIVLKLGEVMRMI